MQKTNLFYVLHTFTGLPGQGFQQAIGSFETISTKTSDKAMHDQRDKAQRDYEWMLSIAQEKALSKVSRRDLNKDWSKDVKMER